MPSVKTIQTAKSSLCRLKKYIQTTKIFAVCNTKGRRQRENIVHGLIPRIDEDDHSHTPTYTRPSAGSGLPKPEAENIGPSPARPSGLVFGPKPSSKVIKPDGPQAAGRSPSVYRENGRPGPHSGSKSRPEHGLGVTWGRAKSFGPDCPWLGLPPPLKEICPRGNNKVIVYFLIS